MIVGLLLLIYNTIKPDTKVRTAAQVATQPSLLLNRKGSLANFAYGEDLEQNRGTCLAYRPLVSYKVDQEPEQEKEHHLVIQEEYLDDETEVLNEEARVDLLDLYKNNKKLEMKI